MLIRLITSISKWDESKKVNRDDAFICGDCISDLRTTDNKLSVWKADSQEDIDDAIVALALNRDSVSKINYFFLKEEELARLDIEISDTEPGIANGLEETILHKHRDLIEIDYWRLGFLAEYMINLARVEENRKSMTRQKVKELLNKYKEDHKIEIESINEKLKADLKW